MSADCSACNSSEARQAAFMSAIFEAWDRHAARIPAINFNWLTDVPAASVAEWETYYGVSAPAFLQYLATLGLRHRDGTPKAAWDTLLQEAAARGFGD